MARPRHQPLDFKAEFHQAVARHNLDFHVRGILTTDDRVLPLGTDTKVLSTVFELLVRPLIREIAAEHDLQVAEAVQTIYPDFTLMRDPDDRQKIAVDVKTTYRRPEIAFTLGSYTSFLRNNTKNIRFPYDHYAAHWIIGFVYTRQDNLPTDIHPIYERDMVVPAYRDVEWFVQEKYKIAGESPGSGNTANIGSVRSTSLEPFVNGEGPFAPLGEATFRDYWANYGRSADRPYRNLPEYFVWKERTTRR